MKSDLNVIKEEVQRLDPESRQDEYGFQVAVILMAAAVVTGPCVERIASFTKYQPTLVAEISHRMREAGLWTDDSIEYEHWFKGSEWRTVCFLLDVMVAEGSLARQQREDGKSVYRIRDKGKLQ